MGFKILLVLALSVYMVHAGIREDLLHKLKDVGGEGAGHEKTLVDWYDCSGKSDGNYIHPSDCTKFMSCVAQAYAYERECASCHIDPHECPTGRTHYHQPSDACLWAHEAGCVIDPPPTESTPEDVTDDSPPVEGTTPGPQPGCNPDECRVDGYCQDYWWCEREDSDHKGTGKAGFQKRDRCDTENPMLYFNPHLNGGVHGGGCDFWENLRQDTKDTYNGDPACINPHCEWKPDPENECSHKYWYFHPDKNEGQDVEMACPRLADGEQLIWDQGRKSCHVCSSVHREDSTPCC